MILEPKNTAVAYRCPECGSGVMSAVGIFNLSADRLTLRCSNPECAACGKGKNAAQGPNANDRMDIVIDRSAAGEGKVNLTVPCIFCGKPHTYSVNTSLFFGRDVFVLSCPYSGINICFMGESNHVKAELARSELELLDMLEENGIENFKSLSGDEAVLPDPQVYEIVMFVIHDLEAEGKIFCRCGHSRPEDDAAGDADDAGTERPSDADTSADDGYGDYAAEVTDRGVRVFCRRCGAQKLIQTDSLIGANDFLNCDSLTLE